MPLRGHAPRASLFTLALAGAFCLCTTQPKTSAEKHKLQSLLRKGEGQLERRLPLRIRTGIADSGTNLIHLHRASTVAAELALPPEHSGFFSFPGIHVTQPQPRTFGTISREKCYPQEFFQRKVKPLSVRLYF